jgi:hypothetical protein
MKRCLLVVAPLGLLAGAVLLNAGFGQSPSDAGQGGSGGGGFRVGSGGGNFGRGSAFGGAGVMMPVTRARSEISRLVGELRDATEDAKKTEITKKLEEAVTKAFEEDQKSRETELTKLEERLKKLRGQLDRRAKAKSDIIQLQLKVLVNEAEGLGFSGTSLSDHAGYSVIAAPASAGYQNLVPLPGLPGGFPQPDTVPPAQP